MHCVQYIWNIDIMQARARLLERKMEEDQVRRTLRYLAKVETVEYRAKVPLSLCRAPALRGTTARPCAWACPEILCAVWYCMACMVLSSVRSLYS